MTAFHLVEKINFARKAVVRRKSHFSDFFDGLRLSEMAAFFLCHGVILVKYHCGNKKHLNSVSICDKIK